jgi:hypothetical protein
MAQTRRMGKAIRKGAANQSAEVFALPNFITASMRASQQAPDPLYFQLLSKNFSKAIHLFSAKTGANGGRDYKLGNALQIKGMSL